MAGLEPYALQPEVRLAADLLETLGIPVTALVDYAEAVRERRARRIALLIRQGAEGSGLTPEQLLARAAEDDLTGDFLEGAATAAAKSRSDEQIAALARVLAVAAAGGDGARADDLHAVLEALTQLGPHEIRALHALEATGPVSRDSYDLPNVKEVITNELDSASLAPVVERRLGDLALVESGAPVGRGGTEWHVVTEFGRRVLTFLATQPTDT